MFTSSLKIAFRALIRRRSITGINILGLVLGMTVFFFLIEYASFHASFDRFHAHSDRIYHIVATTPQGTWSNVPPFALWLKEYSSDIETVVAINGNGSSCIVQYKAGNGGKPVMDKETGIIYGNNDFFTTFNFPFLCGQEELDKPYTTVITASMAQKYFACGNDYTKALGKRIHVTNDFGLNEFTVTGVVKNLPAETQFQGAMMLSLQTLKNKANLGGNGWAELSLENTSAFLDGYVRLKEGTNPRSVEDVINSLHKKIGSKETAQWHLQPLAQIHIGDGFNDPLPNQGMLKFVVIASSIAAFILLLALINYINLSTAFGLTRVREIGVRKTIGASRFQVALPYFLECLLLSVVSMIAAISLVELLQSSFNSLVGAELRLGYVFQFGLGLWAWFALGLGTILAGGYVSFVLAGVNPIVVLKGNFARSKSGNSVRQTLVVLQFAISMAFIVGTIVVYQQLQFMRNRDLGMKLDQVLIVEGAVMLDDEAGGDAISSRAFAFKQELAQMPFVRNVAGTQAVPGKSYNFTTSGIKRPSGSKEDAEKPFSMVICDENYFKTFGMSFSAGKPYVEEDNLGDFRFRNVVINETASKQLGFKTAQEAIGQTVEWGNPNEKGQRFQVCGVLSDYHHISLKSKIDPMIFLPSQATANFAVNLRTDNLSENLAEIERLYKKFFPENQYSAKFANDVFQKQYEDDIRIGEMFAMFTGVAIIIACLGLFGLVSYTVEMRTKEIGVRRVLGASELNIIGILAKDFLKLVVIACFAAIPLAWYAMDHWLQDFAYRISINPGIFLAAMISAILLATFTITLQSWKAARRLPIETLRQE